MGQYVLNIDKIMSAGNSNFSETFYSDKKILLYGAGGVTESLLLNSDYIESIICICDKKAPETVGEFMGYPYMQFNQAIANFSNFYVAISSLKFYSEIKQELSGYIPEDRILPYTDWETRIHFNMERNKYNSWLKDNEESLQRIYSSLGDEKSRKSMESFLMGMENISADDWLNISYYSPTCLADFFPHEYFKFSSHSVYLDCGACDGDTVLDFIRASNNQYSKILAFEPDTRVFGNLTDEAKRLNDSRIFCYQKAVGDHNGTVGFKKANNPFLNEVDENAEDKVEIVTIDSIPEPIDMIKVAINGNSNVGILEGGRKYIAKHRPQLSYVIPPNETVIIDVPLKILEICPDYKLYLRMTAYPMGGAQRIAACYYAVAR